ncbi:MAG: hypothetical protein GC178_01615 [Flavobacteriales bacterium]|nr:hypothetical protein [Flavobacteriales bacterium]
MDRIEKTWFQLTKSYNSDPRSAQKWFDKIVGDLTAPDRHYHNLSHVEHLLLLIEKHEAEISNQEALQLAAFFHDLIYIAGSSSNERHSADQAILAMAELGIPKETRASVVRMILATKLHKVEAKDESPDLLLFLDMDLAVLGSAGSQYDAYCKAVELEFQSCPKFMYKRGRERFLKATLSQPFIYRTATFRTELEVAARTNLSRELATIGSIPSLLDYRSIMHSCVKRHSKNELTY